MKPGQEFFNPSQQTLYIFDFENDKTLSVEYGEVIKFLHMRETNPRFDDLPTAIVEYMGKECWMRVLKFAPLTSVLNKEELESAEEEAEEEEERLVLWMSDSSTYEFLDPKSHPTLTLVTKEGAELVQGGHELHHWTSEEKKRYIEKQVSLTELIDFYVSRHPGAL